MSWINSIVNEGNCQYKENHNDCFYLNFFSEEHERKIDEYRDQIKRQQDMIRLDFVLFQQVLIRCWWTKLLIGILHSFKVGFMIRQCRAEAATNRLDADLLRTEADMACLQVKTITLAISSWKPSFLPFYLLNVTCLQVKTTILAIYLEFWRWQFVHRYDSKPNQNQSYSFLSQPYSNLKCAWTQSQTQSQTQHRKSAKLPWHHNI